MPHEGSLPIGPGGHRWQAKPGIGDDRTGPSAGEVFAETGGLLGDLRPAGRFGEVEANQAMVRVNQLGGRLLLIELACKPGDLVVEGVRQALQKDKRKTTTRPCAVRLWQPVRTQAMMEPA